MTQRERPETEKTKVASMPEPARMFAAGRYVVTRLLGEGGQKRVYLARDTQLDRDVAVAFIKVEGLDEAALDRVRREAQTVARLGAQPHVITIFDIGEEAGRPYTVCEYASGGDLRRKLREAAGPLPIERVLAIGQDLCRGLALAHTHGILHRDLKPENIWFNAEGAAKLGDFGLAVAFGQSRLTAPGTVLGTAAYMAPEQALGGEVDARSDLYSLGCILYEIVTGRLPFIGDDAIAVVSQHINTAPVAPSWHRKEMPKALEALIVRLMAKAPEERPESADVVLEALSAIASAPPASVEPGRGNVSPLDRLAGGVFVGREREAAGLRAGLDAAMSGLGRLVLVAGEPGIGKTRLAEELATYAGVRGARVLWGRCYEGEGAPAYWPWLQAIRAYVHDRDPETLLSEMGAGAADIANVMSEVRERLPGLPEPPTLQPEQARFRLFDSVTTFLKNAARRQPLVLVLDDLHWADESSLLLFQFLVRELRGTRLLVVGVYRDVDRQRDHRLSQTLAELAREQLSERLVLRGLKERDVARFIEMTAGLQPPGALVSAVYQQTEGNPFFVNEVVRLLVSDGRLERAEEVESWSVTIPQGVREVVGRRLDYLSAECNQVLSIASTIGRDFDLMLLGQVVGVPQDMLLAAVQEAVAARIVNDVSRTVGRYSFSHVLIRDALYDELGSARRLQLHRELGEALERLHSSRPEPHLPALAHHFFQAAPAGTAGKAIEYARRAGNQATALFAYEDAAAHFERAIAALDFLAAPDEALRCDLLLALGDAWMKAGVTGKARETLLLAADIARHLDMPSKLGQAALAFVGPWVGAGFAGPHMLQLLQEACDALGDEESALRSMLLARLAVELQYAAPLERRASLGRQAVEIARRTGDAAALAYALNGLYYAVWSPSNVEERLDIAAEMQRLADLAGEKELALQGRHWRTLGLLERGDIEGVDREVAAYGQLAEELRQPVYLYRTAARRAMRALLDGRLEEADRLMNEAFAIGQRAQDPNAAQEFTVQLFALRREQGRLDELAAALREFTEQFPAVPGWRCALAFLHAELGREGPARAEFERLAAGDFADLPQDANWLTAIALLSQVCASLADIDRAGILYVLLRPHERHNVVAGAGAAYNGACSHYLAILAASMGRWREAIAHFEAALSMHAAMGARPWLARTQYEFARALLLRNGPGDHATALDLAKRALNTAQELGMALAADAATVPALVERTASAVGPTSIDAVVSAVTSERPDLRSHAARDGTVTMLFTDIEGSTSLNEQLGDTRWRELLRVHDTIVRDRVHSHRGYVVKSQGDGFMIAFGSARRALQCAIAIQRALAERAVSNPQQAVLVRMGLHTGEVVREAEDFYGRTVNLAARIARQARGGEILASSVLYELARELDDIKFDRGRQVKLKGIRAKQRVYVVTWSRPSVSR